METIPLKVQALIAIANENDLTVHHPWKPILQDPAYPITNNKPTNGYLANGTRGKQGNTLATLTTHQTTYTLHIHANDQTITQHYGNPDSHTQFAKHCQTAKNTKPIIQWLLGIEKDPIQWNPIK